MKKILAAACIVLGLILCVGGYGAASNSVEVTNHLMTGDVDITLKEYAINDKKEVAYKSPETIVPGMTISKIPRITNIAEPCWVRVKITYTSKNSSVKLSDADLSGMGVDWVKKGDYFYYKKVLGNKEALDVFKSVKIPEEWTSLQSEALLGLSIRADAIQAANFNPDFDSENPWGSQKIQKCVHEESSYSAEQTKGIQLTVKFDGESDKWIAVPEDFFANLGTIMPGDVLEDSIEILNDSNSVQNFYFRTSTEGRTSAQLKLLREIKLIIMLDEKKVYEGTLDSKELDSEISLGQCEPEISRKLTFRIEVPSSWNNSYAVSKADVTWIFRAEEKVADENDAPQNNTDSSSAAEKTEKTESVKTEDQTPVELMFAFVFGSGILTAILWKYKRKTGRVE